MKDKKVGAVLKTESKVIAYVVICLVIIVLGISYALFFEVKGNEKNQIVKAGTLEFTYTNGSQITNASNSICFTPMSDEEALRHSECEYKISIRNSGTLPGNYSINLSSVNVENPIALNKLKIILKKEGQVVADYPKEGTTTSLVTNEKIEAGSVINYSVQVYVDADNELLNADDDEKNISLKINGDAVVNEGEINPIDKSLLTNYINELAKSDTTNLMKDGTTENNLRYVGGSPNNYINIGDKDSNGNPILWRIIGVMNNITNLDTGKEESLVKIVRAESIGSYTWDSSAPTINSGYGVNEWSDSDIMKLLNPSTIYNGTPVLGESLYWNHGKGSCYDGDNELYKDCDFTTNGISDEAKNKIAKVRWNTGTPSESHSVSRIQVKYMYDGERSNHNGKQLCEEIGGGDECNDNVERKTTWDGYLALLYPSDYGYALGGNNRATCFEKSMFDFKNEPCNTNNWLIPTSTVWTLTALPETKSSDRAYRIYADGEVNDNRVRLAFHIIPVAYLKVDSKILLNQDSMKEYGSKENPFVLQ